MTTKRAKTTKRRRDDAPPDAPSAMIRLTLAVAPPDKLPAIAAGLRKLTSR